MATAHNPAPLMPVTGHLDELRGRLLWCLAAVGAGTIAGLSAGGTLIAWLKAAGRVSEPLIVIRPVEVVSVYFKVSLAAGIALASPVIAWHAVRFLGPAVGDELRRSLARWAMAMVALFFAGAAFACFVALPFSFNFLMALSRSVAAPMITLGSYVSFAVAIIATGGIVFEMPVAAAVLARTGIVTAALLRARRREAIFGLAVAAAVITPTTDMFTMALFLVPMVALYEISILVVARTAPSGAPRPGGGDNGYQQDQ